MPEKKVQRIEKIQFANMGYKAVGIYARVSTCQPFHLHSMAMQVSALTHQVYRLPQWSLADIYMDFASGAGVDNRSEFQRMINDCVNGKIELVLTKSISRFGRDTVDGLSAIRELKAHGVEVYFDLEELHSFQPDFELQYSIRAAIARGEREDFHDSIVLAMNQKVTDGNFEHLLSSLLWLQESRRRLARHYSGRSRKCAADLRTLSVREKHCGNHARADAAKHLIPDRQSHMEPKGNRYAAQQREVSRQLNRLNCPYERRSAQQASRQVFVSGASRSDCR